MHRKWENVYKSRFQYRPPPVHRFHCAPPSAPSRLSHHSPVHTRTNVVSDYPREPISGTRRSPGKTLNRTLRTRTRPHNNNNNVTNVSPHQAPGLKLPRTIALLRKLDLFFIFFILNGIV